MMMKEQKDQLAPTKHRPACKHILYIILCQGGLVDQRKKKVACKALQTTFQCSPQVS